MDKQTNSQTKKFSARLLVGAPHNFSVNQIPNPWILGFEILDLDLGFDNQEHKIR